jgi:IS605 OrfB family transposase
MELSSLIYNESIDWCWEHKSLNKKTLHKELYFQQRNKYAVPAAIIQTIRDVAIGNLRQTKFKFRPKKNKLSTINYDCRTLKLRRNILSLSTMEKRFKTTLKFPKWCESYVKNGICKSGKLVYDLKSDQFYIHLVFKLPNPTLKETGEIIGLDRGLINLVTTSEGIIYNAKKVRKQQRKYLYLRKKLSSKGTRSSKRLLKKLSGKEKRFSRDYNHCLSKKLANDQNVKVYVIENLKGISKNRHKGKKFNKKLSSWTFFQFEIFLTYKCVANGIEVVKINPKYTSQMCYKCGHIDKNNRNKEQFCCLKCGHKDHADVNAAKNIRRKFFELPTTGLKSITQSDRTKRFMSKIPH